MPKTSKRLFQKIAKYLNIIMFSIMIIENIRKGLKSFGRNIKFYVAVVVVVVAVVVVVLLSI